MSRPLITPLHATLGKPLSTPLRSVPRPTSAPLRSLAKPLHASLHTPLSATLGRRRTR